MSANAPPLRIQLPDRIARHAAAGTCHPPLDDPPFQTSATVVRECVKITAKVQYLDCAKPDAMEEILILTSVNIPVDGMLEAVPDVATNGDGGGAAVDDDDDDEDMFCDSSDFSDFSSDSEEGSEDGDSIMEEDYAGSEEDETEEGEGRRDDADGNRNRAQCAEVPNNRSPSMKAFLKGRVPFIQNPHGRYHISVYRAKVLRKADLRWTETGEEVAIKEVSWDTIRATRGKMSEDFVKEVAALQYVSEWHENEMGGRSMLETHVMAADTIMSDRRNLYIVMPFCEEGDLSQRVAIAEGFQLTEDESRKWFRHILKGLESLQLMRLCHKDLSPENLIILDGRSLVIDFGMCLRIPYSEEGAHPIAPKAACGKLPYIAPELIRQRPFDGHAVDVWAAGTILHHMLTGMRFDHPVTVERDLHTYDYGISDGAADLLRKMLRTDPDKRLKSLDGIRGHEWVRHEFLSQR